jgi:hypothetical protein
VGINDDDFDPKELTDPKTFSFANYTDEFDTHISQSIRGYADLRDDAVGISKYFVEANTQVLDIGFRWSAVGITSNRQKHSNC